MRDVKVLRQFVYNSRQMKAGDVIQLDDSDIADMQSLGYVGAITEQKRSGYKRRDIRAQK